LERQVEVSNQNIAAAEAAYRQSVALVHQARSVNYKPTASFIASYFPRSRPEWNTRSQI
jgi:hypothetical protein